MAAANICEPSAEPASVVSQDGKIEYEHRALRDGGDGGGAKTEEVMGHDWVNKHQS